MVVFDGTQASQTLIAQGMREYRKHPIPVQAVQQDHDFEVAVSWMDKPLKASAGDWLVTDTGSSWAVANDIFQATYEQNDDGTWTKTATIHAVQIDEDFSVKTLEGETVGKAGDWLAQGPAGEAWHIPAASFEATYELV